VRELACEPVEYLVERVAGLRGLREQHGALHRRTREEPLLPQHHLHGDGRQDGVQPRDVVLGDEHADVRPRDGVREGQHDVVGDDHGDAAEDDGLHQAGAPGRPPQRAQAEHGALHVLVVGRRVRRGDVEQRVALEVLPHGRAGAPGVVAALGVVAGVVEEAAEVDEDGPRGGRRQELRLHLPRRRVRRDGDGAAAVLEAHVVPLPERLHQRGAPEHGQDPARHGLLLLEMEAGTEVVRRDEEVVGALGPVPVRPAVGDQPDGAAHHPRGVEGHRVAGGGQVAGGVHGGVEPVRFLGVQGSDGAGEEGPVHEDLRREHVRQATRVLLHRLRVVFRREVVHEHLELAHRVVF